MRQLFETYRDARKALTTGESPPWTTTSSSWASQSAPRSAEFYLRMAVQQRWGKRELERQIRMGAFEQAVLAFCAAQTLTSGEKRNHGRVGDGCSGRRPVALKFWTCRPATLEADCTAAHFGRAADLPRTGPRLLLRRREFPEGGRAGTALTCFSIAA